MSPVPFPDIGIAGVDMMPDPRTTATETAGGDDYVSMRGIPKWRLSIETHRMDRAEFQRLSAWWNGQYGGISRFTISHPERPFPLSYRSGFDGMEKAGAGAFDGTATINALAANSITVQGLPANFVLKAGDMFGLIEGGKYGLYENGADVTGSASGVAVLVPQPFIPTLVFTAAAQVNFAKALVEMKVDPDSFTGQRRRQRMPASFSARQVGY
jgi:hypothetical protein